MKKMSKMSYNEFDLDAGEVKVDIVKIGNTEKNEYKAFTNNRLVIKSNFGITVTYDGYNIRDEYGGLFMFKSGGWEDVVVSLEIVFSLQHPGLLLTSHSEKIPKTLTSQETISAVTEAIMEDKKTADMTLRCGAETFRVHKTFLGSR